MPERRAGDVELGATDHDPVALPVDHPGVGVEVVLFGWWPGPITLGVGYALGDAYVVTLCLGDVGPDAIDVVGFHVGHTARGRLEGLDRGRRDVGHHPGVVQLRDQRPKVIGRRRHRQKRADRVGRGVVVLVVRLGGHVDGLTEDRVAHEIIDPLALEEGLPTIVE